MIFLEFNSLKGNNYLRNLGSLCFDSFPCKAYNDFMDSITEERVTKSLLICCVFLCLSPSFVVAIKTCKALMTRFLVVYGNKSVVWLWVFVNAICLFVCELSQNDSLWIWNFTQNFMISIVKHSHFRGSN